MGFRRLNSKHQLAIWPWHPALSKVWKRACLPVNPLWGSSCGEHGLRFYIQGSGLGFVIDLRCRETQSLSCSLSLVESSPSQFRRHLGFAVGRKGVYQSRASQGGMKVDGLRDLHPIPWTLHPVKLHITVGPKGQQRHSLDIDI